MPDHLLKDDDLDLSPDVMCQLMRRRARDAAMAAASGSGGEQWHPDSGGGQGSRSSSR